MSIEEERLKQQFAFALEADKENRSFARPGSPTESGRKTMQSMPGTWR